MDTVAGDLITAAVMKTCQLSAATVQVHVDNSVVPTVRAVLIDVLRLGYSAELVIESLSTRLMSDVAISYMFMVIQNKQTNIWFLVQVCSTMTV